MNTNFKDFENLNISEIQNFSFEKKCFWCRVIKVYDGDSITGIIKFENKFYKIPIRLNGIDACEIRNSNIILKNRAILCRERLAEIIGFEDPNINCMIWIVCDRNDKYGRVLADLYKHPTDTVRIQDTLIEERQAYTYTGKTKKIEEEQIDYFLNCST